MNSGLMHSDGNGGAVARCVRCGMQAVGPCARCHVPVCGDCCVLTEGGSKIWAICFACEDRGGKSLSKGWVTVLGWLLLPIVGLALVIALLEWWIRR